MVFVAITTVGFAKIRTGKWFPTPHEKEAANAAYVAAHSTHPDYHQSYQEWMDSQKKS